MTRKLRQGSRQNLIKILLIIIIISGIANCIYLLSIPSDLKDNILFGFSANRLILLGFLLTGALFTIFIYVKYQKTPQPFIDLIHRFNQKPIWKNWIILFFLLVSALVWLAFYSPAYFLGRYYSIFERLRPVLIWLQTVSVAKIITAIIFVDDFSFNDLVSDKRYLKKFFISAFLVACAFLLIRAIYPLLTDDLWFGRYSVPILITQTFFSWIFITYLEQVSLQTSSKIPAVIIKNLDLILFLGLWICAALIWMNQPIEFMDDMVFTAIEQHMRPLPPEYTIFPWKDSRTYYHITSSIVNGNGMYRGIDKSLFITFESINNWLSRGRYEEMLNLQVWVLALFPSIMFLLGKQLHSRSSGLLAALVAILQEYNAINLMDDFPLVSSKVLLSEPFMQLWTGLIALCAVIALKKESQNEKNWMLVVGGTLGLSSLFRLNTLVIIPFLLILLFFHYLNERKRLLLISGSFIAGILLALTPWMIHNTVRFGDPFSFIEGKVKGVIINTRYEKITDKSNPDSDVSKTPETPTLYASSSDSSTILASYSGQTNQIVADSPVSMDPMDTTFINPTQDTQNSDQPSDRKDFTQITLTVIRHFLNNIITSLSILPTSVNAQDLYRGSRSQQFWGGYDVNFYEGIDPFVVIFNLLFISVGISIAIHRHKLIGLVPIAVFLGYHLSNALAISSGNRYAQPASWVVFFYFCVGLINLSQWFLRQINFDHPQNKIKESISQSASSAKIKKKRIWLLAAAILSIGSAPIAADVLPVARFPEIDNEILTSLLIENNQCKKVLRAAGYKQWQEFIKPNKEYSAAFGCILEPVQLSKEQFNFIYPHSKKKILENGSLFMFSLMEPKSKKLYLQQISFNSNDPNFDVRNGSDAVILYVGTDAEVIGIIDDDYAAGITSYEDLASIPLECFLAEE